MNNLSNRYSQELADNQNNLYLSFSLGESKYIIPSSQVVEIIKLPHLDYPHKLPNNIVGLLNYNNFSINILDIRFYLNIKVTPYNVNNQLLVLKSDENFFGIIITKVEDIITIDQSKIEYLALAGEDKLIDFFYRTENETLAGLNIYSLENMLKKGVETSDIDIPSLFPQDDESRYKLMQRNQDLIEKSKFDLAKNVFTQDKFISFSLNSNMYCMNLNNIKEFLKNIPITKVPCTPDYVFGLITLRGDFVTVVDLKKIFGLMDDEKEIEESKTNKNRIIVVDAPNYQIGFLVDEIYKIVDIPEEIISQNSQRRLNKFTHSEVVLDERLYTVLDLKNILSDERFFIDEH